MVGGRKLTNTKIVSRIELESVRVGGPSPYLKMKAECYNELAEELRRVKEAAL